MTNNYNFTNKAGETRRRMCTATLRNPAKPLVGENNDVPSVTFIEEDRVILANGKELMNPVGNLIINIDEKMMMAMIPRFNQETGEIDYENQRLGAELVAETVANIGDLYIHTAMARDYAIANPPTEDLEPVTTADNKSPT